MSWDACGETTFSYESIEDEAELTDFDVGDAMPLEEAGCSSTSVSQPPKTRGRKQFMTARLATGLDNAKISDGMAVHILIAAAEALGHRVEELVINRCSMHRSRQENRFKESKEIATSFIDSVIIINFVHF